MAATGSPARPQLIRAMNEQLLLGAHPVTADGHLPGRPRPDLRPRQEHGVAGPGQPGTGRTGAGRRACAPACRARPPCSTRCARSRGFVLGLDVGRQYLRGGVADLNGAIRARTSAATHSTTGPARVAELVALADSAAGRGRRRHRRTSPRPCSAALASTTRTATTSRWPAAARLGEAQRPGRAAAGVRTDAHDRERRRRRRAGRTGPRARRQTWTASRSSPSAPASAWASCSTDGCTAAGTARPARSASCRWTPTATGADEKDARRRGSLEASASAAGIVRAARHAGDGADRCRARQVFAAAARGEPWAVRVVADEALLIARAVCAVVTVVDPGAGRARRRHRPGRRASSTRSPRDLRQLAPVVPDLKVSALGADAVVDGCLAAGIERAWQIVTAAVPVSSTSDGLALTALR